MFDEPHRVTGQSRVVAKIYQYSDLPSVNSEILNSILTGMQQPFHNVTRPAIQSNIQLAAMWGAAGVATYQRPTCCARMHVLR
jgi:hypothetical protein